MRKKKLLSRISELEAENARLKDNEEYWKDLIMQFVKGLHEHGVEAEIVFPEPPIIESISLEGEIRQVRGRSDNGGAVGIRFDFTEHDAKVRGEQNG